MTTNLTPLVAKIQLDITIGEFLEYWNDNEDVEPTQEDYENYCYEYAEAYIVNGASMNDVVLSEKTQ